MPKMSWLAPLAAFSFALTAGALLLAFLYVPTAQCDAGCLAQRIFYFHVPSAYVMYTGVFAAVVGGVGVLAMRTPGWDALNQAGSELAVLCASMVMITGPLWGRKAWGAYWTWDPRLTTTMLAALIFVAVLVLRSTRGEAERRFAAALSILGSAVIPVIHYSVQLWRGQHPTVITRRGGGLADPRMGQTLGLCFVAFTLLAIVFIALRSRMAMIEDRIEALRTDAELDAPEEA